MVVFSRYCMRARLPELLCVCATGLVAVVFWQHALPTRRLRPDLAPEQMVQLLAALQACAAAMALRADEDPHQLLASVSVSRRRALWMLIVVSLTAASVAVSTTSMPSQVAWQYVRNVSAYLGVTLGLATMVGSTALAAPWVWFAASVTAGQASDRGSAVAAWWAYPLHEADRHPEAAVIMLLGAVLVRLRQP